MLIYKLFIILKNQQVNTKVLGYPDYTKSENVNKSQELIL